MHYSFSALNRKSVSVTVHSTFVYHDASTNYIISLVFHRNGSKAFHRVQKSFSSIDKAERFHADSAIRLMDKGYDLQTSNCKYAIGTDFY